MQNDVHFAALKAAARVAFSVALLGGCSAGVEESLLGNEGNDGQDDSASSESAINSSKHHRKHKVEAATTDCHHDPVSAPSCDNVLASAFGDGGWPDPNMKASDDVKACCEKEINPPTDADADAVPATRSIYHWQCCGALDWKGPGMACTPWGPPVPPSMRRARRAGARMVA